MEITRKGKFITDFYGGKAYLSGDEIVKNWLESQSDRLLHPRYRELKSAIGNESKLEDILSVFNTNGDGEPVIGNWMLFECSMTAAKLSGTWSKFMVSADQWENSIQFTPVHAVLKQNGKLIKEPQGVEVYTISLKKPPRSFFKAYQIIKAGATFKVTLGFPDDLCTSVEGKGQNKIFKPDPKQSKECIMTVMDKMGDVGLGAYRRRFGKFEWVS